ncbi:Ig-like domain-containing protein [Haloferula sp. A504]|uniref:Ig-like domain-containing protein n=1 Tax=Haloferula sp. A504 TaxID=3373601 RepID=UPI0031C79035|nr:Ig-like domain-containing protein [Verrucomicrobiaceae bacterium E54]
MKKGRLSKTIFLAFTGLAAMSASATVLEGWTSVDTLDYDRVIGAWNFVDSDNPPGSDLVVEGVTFTTVDAGDGTYGDLTVGGLLGASSGFTTGQTISSGGTTTQDETNLTTIVTTNLNGKQGVSPSGDLTLDLDGLASGTYFVQYFFSINGGTDRYFNLTAEGTTTIGEVARTSGTTFNYLISGNVEVTDGTLNLRVESGPASDNRRLISGLLVSTTGSLPPVLVSEDPADDSTIVLFPSTQNLTATFNENIVAGTGNIELRNLDTSAITTIAVTDATQVSISGKVLTIDPTADLDYGTDYAVRIDSGALVSTGAIDYPGISDDVTWNFTTLPFDETDPTVVSLSPTDNSTVSRADEGLMITFDEIVQAGTGNIEVINTTTLASELIDITDTSRVTFSGNTVTVVTDQLVAGDDYAVQIDATAITDRSFNPYAGIADNTTWNFSVDATAPQLLALTSVDVLDLTNVVGAYDFTGADSITANGTSFSIGGVNFTRHNWMTSSTTDLVLTNSRSDANAPSNAPNISEGGTASDQANLTVLLDYWAQGNQGGSGADMIATVSGLTNGTYKIQYLIGTNNTTRSNAIFYRPEVGDDVLLEDYSIRNENIVITAGGIEVTDGSLRLVMAQGPTSDNRRIIAGLIISSEGGGGGDPDYSTWATNNGIPGELFEDDFNSDGISNGVAYALGLSPTASSYPVGALSGNTITFAKGADAISNGDVTWIIQTSETLAPGSWVDAVTQAAGDPTATISYTFTPGSPDSEFARLKAEQSP